MEMVAQLEQQSVSIILDAVAPVALGIVVGLILRYFLERFEKYDVKTLAALLAAPFAGTLIAYVAGFGKDGKPLYAIGVFIGILVYGLIWNSFPRLHLPMRKGAVPSAVSIQKLEAKLEILDASGNRAKMTRTQTMRARQSVPNFRFLVSQVGVPPGKLNILSLTSSTHTGTKCTMQSSGGIVEIWAEFTEAIEKNTDIGLELIYEIADAFPATTEYLSHQVMDETEEAALTVHFPTTRQCTQSVLLLEFGAVKTPVPKSKLSHTGIKVAAPLPKNLSIGSIYRLQWEW